MLRQLIRVGLWYCVAVIPAVFGQGFSTAPFQYEPDVDLKYVDGNYVAPPSPGKTNWYRVQTSRLQYGDKITIRTLGTYAVKSPGDEEFGGEGAQPFLGFFTGVMTHPNFFYHPTPLQDSGAPRYVTPPVEVNGESVPTDVELDFLIPPGGVTVCVPVQGNFLTLLNPDPRVAARDEGDDFRIEVIPVEGARFERSTQLSSPEVTVGDMVGLTINITNTGNVPAFLRVFDNGRGEVRVDSNLVVKATGPTPSGTLNIPPGGIDRIDYTFRTLAPGTNIFNPEIGQTVCGDQFYGIGSPFASLIIKPLIEITPREPSLEVYSEASVEAGTEDADAPLRYTEDEAILTAAPEFAGRGLIADGVTPLLLRLEVPPDKRERFESEIPVRLKATVVSGQITGAPIEDRLELFRDGEWVSGGEALISKTNPVAHAALKPFKSDEIKFADRQVEVTLQIDVQDNTGLTLGRIQILIRRPPIALIHGYNTDGAWGEDFLRELRTARGTSIIQVARYGQDETGGPTGSQAQINTLWPLKNLAPLAERALEDSLESVRSLWLFTRHDVVAHSQGGLLTRMLCSRNPNNHVPLPYRNERNFFRGRFHRVITIGSPHNGTRLLRYLLALNQNEDDALPSWVGYALVGASIAQPKFDPWGVEIFDLNDPSPSAPWAPDPAARFHLVQTSVNGGATFSPDPLTCPSLWALGLDNPQAGEIVANQGSDGVVDYASMLAVGPFAAEPPNSYSVPAINRISHAFYEIPGLGEAFGATTGQVLSQLVAQHVIGALDQNETLPAEDRAFGEFPVPPMLDLGIRDSIDQLALSFEAQPIEPIFDGVPTTHSTLGTHANPPTFTLRLVPPSDLHPTNKIYWTAYLLTTNGVSGRDVSVLPRTDPLEARIRLNSGVYGDLVLEGIYQSTNGTRVVLKPYLVASPVPSGVTAQSMEVFPRDSARQPAGISVPMEIWTTWSDGRKSRRFVRAGDLQVASSAPNIVDVSNPLVWRTRAPGEATLTTTFEGQSYTAHWTVFDPDEGESTPVPLLIEKSNPSGVRLSWPSASGNFHLQSSSRLGLGASWQDVSEVGDEVNGRYVIQLPSNTGTLFYRLQSSEN